MIEQVSSVALGGEEDEVKSVGLYAADGTFTSWDTLVSNGNINVDANGVITDSNRGLTGELVISNTITSINSWAFSSTSFNSVIIPNSVTSIGDAAFATSALKNVVIGNSVSEIGANAFQGTTSLTSVVMGDSVTTIGKFAFQNTSLTSVIIPKKVTSIGESAFLGTQLTNVVISKSVTSIGSGAFGYTSLTDVYYEGTEAEWNAISIDNTNAENTKLINATKHYNYVY